MRCKWCVCVVLVAAAACSSKRDNNNPDATGTCTIGTRQCDGNSFEVCESTGWTVVEQCPLYCSQDGCTSCDTGDCGTTACGTGSDQSNIGCEYWAVDLDNATEVFGQPNAISPPSCELWPSTKLLTRPMRVCYDGTLWTAGECDPPNDFCPTGYTCVDSPSATLPMGVCGNDGDQAPFAVVVSNPQAVAVAVTIDNAAGTSMSIPVDPDSIATIYPQQIGFADQSVDGTQHAALAYRITSTAPIVAYQFNPLNNVDVFSNDASLLIPTTGFDTRYFGVSYPTLTRRDPVNPGRDNFNGYITVVAAQDDTEIEITPTANTNAGRDGTPALTAGQTATFTLNKYDIFSFEAVAGPNATDDNGNNGGDLTGSVVQGTNAKPFGVFGGHEAVRIEGPNSDCCADHLEQMLFPTTTWGKRFAVEQTVVRRAVPDLLRVVAGTANTQVTFTPQVTGGPCPVLQPGQFCEVQFTVPTEISSTQPIMLAHLMQSAILGMDGTGDPSLGILPPVEQFRNNYKFLVPDDYDEQYVNIVGMTGDDIELDGMPVTGLGAFGAGRVAAVVTVTTGPHTVTCPLQCGVEVYGWSQAVSYMFAGGLNLNTIVIE